MLFRSWVVEGLGVFTPDGGSLDWPGGDWAVLALFVLWMLTAQATVFVLRRLVGPRTAGA